jgi:hypothetical protein
VPEEALECAFVSNLFITKVYDHANVLELSHGFKVSVPNYTAKVYLHI